MSGRVTIAGYFGARNTGDEAILAGMVRSLRRHEIHDLTVLSWDPEATRRRHGTRSLPIGRRQAGLWRLFRHLQGEDLFLLGGGGLLQDHSPRVVPFWASRVLLARAAGVPVMYYGLGVGPLNRALSRRIVAAVSNRARAITVRDPASKALLEAAGVRRPAIEVTADPALCLDLSAADPSPVWEAPPAAAGVLSIAVCLRAWPGFDELLPRLSSGLIALRRRHPVRYLFIPFQDPEDRAVSQEVLRRVEAAPSPGSSGLLAPGHSPEEIAGLLSRMDGVVAMRLHGAVLAALSGVPTFGLVYDPKVRAFLERASSGEHSATLAELRHRPEEVAGRLIRWLEARQEQRRAMQPAVRRMVAEAGRSAEIASRLLARGRRGGGPPP